jgi:inner membrane protein
MDSVTQMVLGSAVSVAVMGRKVPIWQSALIGASFGALPDLDVVLDHGDPVSNMTYHRAETHALFWLTLAAPAGAWLVARITHTREWFRHWWLAIWLVWVTHILLDALTIYGTQLLLPFSNYPVGLGSIFIIDPLYTLPLIAGVLLALVFGGRRGLNANRNGLILSTLYLCWGVMAQQNVASVADRVLAQQAVTVEQRLILPTPFNSLLWRVLVITPEQYGEGFYSLADREPDIVFNWFPRGTDLYQALGDNVHARRLAWFSHGYFRLEERDGVILMSDLRMGQEPYYFFTFSLAERTAQGLQSMAPTQHRQREDLRRGLNWLFARSLDADVAPLHVRDHDHGGRH